MDSEDFKLAELQTEDAVEKPKKVQDNLNNSRQLKIMSIVSNSQKKSP
jgi:hypothetical protein